LKSVHTFTDGCAAKRAKDSVSRGVKRVFEPPPFAHALPRAVGLATRRESVQERLEVIAIHRAIRWWVAITTDDVSQRVTAAKGV